MVFRVAGLKYHEFVFPSENDFLFLVPEPENIFDKSAVCVYNQFHQQVGYVPVKGGYNEKMLKLISQDSAFCCKVVLSNPRHQFILIDVLIREKGATKKFVLKKYRLN